MVIVITIDAKYRQYKTRQGNWNYTQSDVLQELSSWYMQLVVYLSVTFIPWRASISSFFCGSVGWCSTESTSKMETGKTSLSQTCYTVLYTLHSTPLFGLALYTLTSADIFSILIYFCYDTDMKNLVKNQNVQVCDHVGE